MIKGIGTDIIEIDRVEKAINRTEGFLNRYFTLNEIEMFEQKKFNPQTIAGNFSAKESISKALGTGVRGFGLKDIEILRDELGKPIVKLSEDLRKKLNILDDKIHVSISHDKTSAISFAVIED